MSNIVEEYEDYMDEQNLREEIMEGRLVDVAKEIIKSHGQEDTNRVLLADHTEWPAGVIKIVSEILEEQGFGRSSL